MKDIILTDTNQDQEIVLDEFVTPQGWEVKIDLKTRSIYTTTSGMAILAEMPRPTLQLHLAPASELTEYLRKYAVTAGRKTLKTRAGRTANCFNLKQTLTILRYYNSPILEATQEFGFTTAIYQACGLLETAKEINRQLSPSELIVQLLPFHNLALENPGLEQLALRTNSIPCLILSDKPFKLRFWVQIHFQDFNLSRRAALRLGREVSAVSSQHKLVRPKNSYTTQANQYTKADHELINQIFLEMRSNGLLD